MGVKGWLSDVRARDARGCDKYLQIIAEVSSYGFMWDGLKNCPGTIKLEFLIGFRETSLHAVC